MTRIGSSVSVMPKRSPVLATKQPALLDLADVLLGESTVQRISTRRAGGQTFRQIVRDICAETGGRVDITEQTARTWLREYASAAA